MRKFTCDACGEVAEGDGHRPPRWQHWAIEKERLLSPSTVVDLSYARDFCYDCGLMMEQVMEDFIGRTKP